MIGGLPLFELIRGRPQPFRDDLMIRKISPVTEASQAGQSEEQGALKGNLTQGGGQRSSSDRLFGSLFAIVAATAELYPIGETVNVVSESTLLNYCRSKRPIFPRCESGIAVIKQAEKAVRTYSHGSTPLRIGF